ncbi:MAG: 4-hydroxy-tetrahydrodipicolinate synthase [Chloroflexi bacterium]|nr:4-hydroxy-tetrahydrodipicolinate synthase [Chloroflexota bacterium]
MLELGRLITAMVTPIAADGSVDYGNAKRLALALLDSGSDGLVVAGTTGESATLSHAEKLRLFEEVKGAVGDRGAVIGNTGTHNTAESVELTRDAERTGIDGLLAVTPYYNKPTQEGLYQHYKAIHDAVEIPIVIYNIPARSVVDMSVETMARLAELPNIVGVKDATADLTRPAKTRAAMGKGFMQVSGEDATVVPFLAQGGHGCISVTANVAPRQCADLHGAWRRGDFDTVARINDRLMPLHEALFVESSPAPVKYAASLLDLCENRLRLPLVSVRPETEEKVRDAMIHAGLIN